jgi:hypothetical protein
MCVMTDRCTDVFSIAIDRSRRLRSDDIGGSVIKLQYTASRLDCGSLVARKRMWLEEQNGRRLACSLRDALRMINVKRP